MPRCSPQEFREDVVVVARGRQPGQQLKRIAADRGISESRLTSWLKAADVDDGAAPGPRAVDNAELREARKRIRLRERENEVLRRHTDPVRFPGSARVSSSGSTDLGVAARDEHVRAVLLDQGEERDVFRYAEASRGGANKWALMAGLGNMAPTTGPVLSSRKQLTRRGPWVRVGHRLREAHGTAASTPG